MADDINIKEPDPSRRRRCFEVNSDELNQHLGGITSTRQYNNAVRWWSKLNMMLHVNTKIGSTNSQN